MMDQATYEIGHILRSFPSNESSLPLTVHRSRLRPVHSSQTVLFVPRHDALHPLRRWENFLASSPLHGSS
eukprot:3373964-Pyramimonas_sp.AAC.1